MEIYQSKCVEKFIDSWLKFSLQLKEKKGINNELLEKLTVLSEEIRKEFEDKSDMPKGLASIFLDLYSVTERASYLYPEIEQQEILDTAYQLTELARDICL